MRSIKVFVLPLQTLKIRLITIIVIAIIIHFLSMQIIILFNFDQFSTNNLTKTELITNQYYKEGTSIPKIDDKTYVYKNGVHILNAPDLTGDVFVARTTEQSIDYYKQWMSADNHDLYMVPNMTNQLEKELDIPISSIGYDHMIVGEFPENNNEIMIGEIVANGYLELMNISSLSNLIGKEISIQTENSEKEFTICGVYSGGLNYVIAPVQGIAPKGKSSYHNFETIEQKNNFIKENNLEPGTYISKDKTDVNPIAIVKLISLFITYVLSWFCLSEEMIEEYKVLCYYQNRKSNYLYYGVVVIYMSVVFLLYFNVYL